MNGLSYYWRVIATGFCFLSFSVGGFVLSVIVFPIIYCLPLQNSWKKSKSQCIIHHSFRLFVGLMQRLKVLKVSIDGREQLTAQSGQLIIANHPSLIDVVVLISLLPQTNCIVKHGLWSNLFVKGAVKAAGYINNSTPMGLIEDCAAELMSGRTLIIFPEGTRTTPGETLKFQRGAAKIACYASTDITPVSIQATSGTLIKGSRWYQIPKDGPVEISLKVGKPIHVGRFYDKQKSSLPLAARRLNRYLQDYFQEEVLTHV